MEIERIKVLFVDDEENNLKAFRSAFRREMDVLLANSGQAALELLRMEKPHVIISDQRMPGMTGAEFLAKARVEHPDAMRMLLTGYADMEAVINAVNNGGIYAYATKPWDENDLRLRINQAYEIHQLRSEKERLLHQYKQVFEASGDPIIMVDADCKVIEANEACARLLAMQRPDLISNTFINMIEDPKGLIGSLKKARKGHDFINVDLSIRNTKGDLIDCLMTATYLGRRSGTASVFQAVIKDITDRKKEEEHLRKLNADLDKRVAIRTSQLMEALEDIGSFSYTVAHDLRSPLKNISALTRHLQEIVEEGCDPKDLLEFTERISKGSARMIELVDDLLRFSQTNDRQVERADIPLKELVNAVLEEQVPDDRKEQIIVHVDGHAIVSADAPMLKVVLHNLVSNALKFTRNTQEPRILIQHREEHGDAIITVRDNGIGFDPQHQEQVFSAFKRLHNSSQFEGTGLGLAIVQRVVARHGGKVWAESAVGEGTAIHFTIPRNDTRSQWPPFFKVA